MAVVISSIDAGQSGQEPRLTKPAGSVRSFSREDTNHSAKWKVFGHTMSNASTCGPDRADSFGMSSPDGTCSSSTSSLGFAELLARDASLEDGTAEQEEGTTVPEGFDALPSIGSDKHASGECTPCAWFHKAKGCINDKECRHCHLCQEGEKKLRKKVKAESMRKTKDQNEPLKLSTSLQPESGESPLLLLDGTIALHEPKLQVTTCPKRSDALPSIGSGKHASGNCTPCAWFHKLQGCINGKDCRHCHLCRDGEKKLRKKVKAKSVRKTEEKDELQQTDVQPKVVESPLLVDSTISLYPGLRPLMSQASELHESGDPWYIKPHGCKCGAECGECLVCLEGNLNLLNQRPILRRHRLQL